MDQGFGHVQTDPKNQNYIDTGFIYLEFRVGIILIVALQKAVSVRLPALNPGYATQDPALAHSQPHFMQFTGMSLRAR